MATNVAVRSARETMGWNMSGPLSRGLCGAVALTLTGCGAGYSVFHPKGPVASAEYHYTLLITGVMMLIIAPTILAVCLFAWRYRKGGAGRYDPEFSHSMALELAMWGVPLVLVFGLGFCAYASVFAVNPAGPGRLATVGVAAPGLQVDVVTTDWQWLFIYPTLGIAAVDELVVPQGETVHFQLTSATVVNDFYIPEVAPMIDVMPGMRTLDALREDQTGDYEGISADFSGAGFSWMEFATHVVSPKDFAAWVSQAKAAPDHLDFAGFQKLAQPTINRNDTPKLFSNVDPGLFLKVYNAVRNGEVFPVPEDIDTKAPYPSPTNGKQGEVKSKS